MYGGVECTLYDKLPPHLNAILAHLAVCWASRTACCLCLWHHPLTATARGVQVSRVSNPISQFLRTFEIYPRGAEVAATTISLCRLIINIYWRLSNSGTGCVFENDEQRYALFYLCKRRYVLVELIKLNWNSMELVIEFLKVVSYH